MHCSSPPNSPINSRSPAIDPPSDWLDYATLRRASRPEHFMNLSYLERDKDPSNRRHHVPAQCAVPDPTTQIRIKTEGSVRGEGFKGSVDNIHQEELGANL